MGLSIDDQNRALGLTGSTFRVPSAGAANAGLQLGRGDIGQYTDMQAQREAAGEQRRNTIKGLIGTAVKLYTGGAFGGGGGALGGLGGAKPDGNAGGWKPTDQSASYGALTSGARGGAPVAQGARPSQGGLGGFLGGFLGG